MARHRCGGYRPRPGGLLQQRHHISRRALWRFLAATGCRRGEALGLTWADVLPGRVSIRRAAKSGEAGKVHIGWIKNRHVRVVDVLDGGGPLVDAQLPAHKASRGGLHLDLVRPESPVFSDLDGRHRHPKAITAAFGRAMARYRKQTGAGAPPRITVHGLRHTHASLLLDARWPVKVVAERVGDTEKTIQDTYSHKVPGSQAALLSLMAGNHDQYQSGITAAENAS